MLETSRDPHGLARAFLALGDDQLPIQPSPARALAALFAALVLCVAAPLGWIGSASKVRDQPAATLSSSKALLHPDDEDNDG
jgi:hypothetical protein